MVTVDNKLLLKLNLYFSLNFFIHYQPLNFFAA